MASGPPVRDTLLSGRPPLSKRHNTNRLRHVSYIQATNIRKNKPRKEVNRVWTDVSAWLLWTRVWLAWSNLNFTARLLLDLIDLLSTATNDYKQTHTSFTDRVKKIKYIKFKNINFKNIQTSNTHYIIYNTQYNKIINCKYFRTVTNDYFGLLFWRLFWYFLW